MLEDAIRHRTEAQLRAMEENLKAQEVLTQHYSRQEYVNLNHTFHWLVVEPPPTSTMRSISTSCTTRSTPT